MANQVARKIGLGTEEFDLGVPDDAMKSLEAVSSLNLSVNDEGLLCMTFEQPDEE